MIHQWFNVWGLSEQDYEIGKPERQYDCRYMYSKWSIRVKISVCFAPFSWAFLLITLHDKLDISIQSSYYLPPNKYHHHLIYNHLIKTIVTICTSFAYQLHLLTICLNFTCISIAFHIRFHLHFSEDLVAFHLHFTCMHFTWVSFGFRLGFIFSSFSFHLHFTCISLAFHVHFA
jgi:hypothetical protein